MRGIPDHPLPPLAASPEFSTTHWSVVRLAGGTTTPDAIAALERLCCTYWYPLYAYVRRRGYSSEDAQDLTQSYFAGLLEKKYLDRADRERGRFRTFLLSSLENFLNNEWVRASAQKRGGGQRNRAGTSRPACRQPGQHSVSM